MSRLRREVRVFFTAVMFLTRLPVPRWTDHRPEYLRQAPRYFPWVGLIVGLIAAGVYEAARLVFPVNIALVASMVSSILATGAFHEDGFADVCDGFGGGWTKEKILAIMKDSRLGTFGVIGLGAMLGLKFLTLQALTGAPLVALLLFAHAASRLFPVAIMQTYPYAGDTEASKSRDVTGRLQPVGILLALGVLVVPALMLPPAYLLTLVPAALVTFGLARYFARWIGGYTGDCLGAIQQVTELTIYLGAYIIASQ
ncbi:adenosylcobinamide-GDP ribazoletransferase [Dinghuibacter silviterrae]|uniref:Adenosylcobinamide-GDP ribazoletransferase n=1 Tax=Dinghuibacter silviterrae TaxID=1539049 RepID=A0A4R8DQL2_9BACT|nr:adenosylcobinamide-GDP ribazoletransferase [Dinghuibacter silviterrae]TDX00078.1 cobalamin-5'-phosphate synthase [Dinghuibacter silviterrae]